MNWKHVIVQFVLFFTLLFCSSRLSAQTIKQDEKIISLNEAISLAMEKNKELLIQQGEIGISISKEKVLKTDKLPNISFESEISLLDNIYQYESGLFKSSTTYEVPRVTYDFSLHADIPLYVGGRIKNEEKLAKLETEGLNLDLQFQQRKIRLKIITAFLNVLHLEEQQKLISDKMKEDELIIKQIIIMHKNGLVTSNEVLRVKLLLSTHQLAFSDLEKEKRIVAEQLKPILGIEDEGSLSLSTVDVLNNDLVSLAKNSSTQDYWANNENLRKLDLSKQGLAIEKQQVKAASLPSLYAMGSYAYAYPNFKFFPPQEYLYRNGGIGLKLHVPISTFYKNREKIAIANGEIKNADLKFKEAQEQIKMDVQIAQLKYQQVSEKINIAQEAIHHAEENYRIVKTKYMNQLSLITELMDADHAYLEAESKLISLTIDKKLKYYQLQFSLGNI